jgi:hypothetical protein
MMTKAVLYYNGTILRIIDDCQTVPNVGEVIRIAEGSNDMEVKEYIIKDKCMQFSFYNPFTRFMYYNLAVWRLDLIDKLLASSD